MSSPDDNAEVAIPRWSVERRLEFIEHRLIWDGRINRFDLVNQFGISPNQATADLKRFETLYPGALLYDTRARTYRSGPGLRRPDDKDVQRLLRELRLIAEGVILPGDGTLPEPPPLALADTPPRMIPAANLATVITAIRDHSRIDAIYQSFSTPRPRHRRLEPHALVFDGFRWHARARDVEENRFKDFVLGRLTQVSLGEPSSSGLIEDEEWNTTVELVITPHPGLSPSQHAVIAADYGMKRGRLVLPVRQAVAYYVKRRLGLLKGHETLAPEDQQILLISERTIAHPRK